MKIALAQLNYTVGDLTNNKVKIINAIREAVGEGADMVVFSEYAVSGCPCYDLLSKSPFIDACEEALHEIATHCVGISALVGVPIQDTNSIMSAAAFIQNGHVVRYIGKQNVHARSESSFLAPSKGCEFVEVEGHKVAVVVGEDILTEREFGNYADTVAVLYSQPYHRGVIDERYDLISKLAYVSGKNIVMVNHLGGQSDFVYDASSCACNSQGKHIAFLKSFEEDFVIVDTESEPVLDRPHQDRDHNTYRAIRLGLSDYFEKNGFTKACVGLSGGIDSAVVTALAVDVLGPENVKVLMLPSQFSSEHSVEDSIQMAEILGIDYDVIPIMDAYRAVTDTLKPALGITEFDVTEENIQSRLRCVMLMALSNKYNYILLNTSNKSEAAVGYGTLYGDCAGSLGPIGDLYKIEVYSLARYINRNKTVIPENILTKEPSAELRPGQKDSDSLPPYDIMDAVLFRFIEEGQSVDEITDAGFDSKTVKRILSMLKLSEYKRRQSAPPIRVSTRPFSSHFILPLLNKFDL